MYIVGVYITESVDRTIDLTDPHSFAGATMSISTSNIKWKNVILSMINNVKIAGQNNQHIHNSFDELASLNNHLNKEMTSDYTRVDS